MIQQLKGLVSKNLIFIAIGIIALLFMFGYLPGQTIVVDLGTVGQDSCVVSTYDFGTEYLSQTISLNVNSPTLDKYYFAVATPSTYPTKIFTYEFNDYDTAYDDPNSVAPYYAISSSFDANSWKVKYVGVCTGSSVYNACTRAVAYTQAHSPAPTDATCSSHLLPYSLGNDPSYLENPTSNNTATGSATVENNIFKNLFTKKPASTDPQHTSTPTQKTIAEALSQGLGSIFNWIKGIFQ